METRYSLYVLKDPVSKEIRYVGKTKKRLSRRLTEHLDESKRVFKKSYRHNWILQILATGNKPEIEHLASTISNDNANYIEKFLIRFYKDLGYRLVNTTDGGDGASGAIHTEEHKLKMSILMKHLSETGQNKGCFKPGRELHPNWRPSRGRLGSKITTENLEKLQKGRRLAYEMNGHPMQNKKHSESSKLKMSAAKKGKTLKPEHKQKIKESLKQHKPYTHKLIIQDNHANTYIGVQDAITKTGLSERTIGRLLKNGKVSKSGYSFKKVGVT